MQKEKKKKSFLPPIKESESVYRRYYAKYSRDLYVTKNVRRKKKNKSRRTKKNAKTPTKAEEERERERGVGGTKKKEEK